MSERKYKFANWVYEHFGDKFWDDSPCPPGSMQTLRLKTGEGTGEITHVFSFEGTDGHEMYIGYPDKWLYSVPSGMVPKLAWFLLWEWWIKATWFGLKKKIWFTALHEIVEHQKNWAKDRALGPFKDYLETIDKD